MEKDNKSEGKGKMLDENGSQYDGEWKYDKREGKGKMTYNDGKIEEGNYVNVQFQNQGYLWKIYFLILKIEYLQSFMIFLKFIIK